MLGRIILLSIIFIAGCGDRGPQPPQLEKKINSTAEKPVLHRFKVESFGVFYGGYGNTDREILIVTDTETGIEYLSITGCGTTEMHREQTGKTSVIRER